ncbi:MAG: hypothetical protein ACE5J9_03640, partial [Methanosarcinales archaeon]
ASRKGNRYYQSALGEVCRRNSSGTYDILAPGKQKNKEVLLVAEVKSTLKVSDVQEFLEELDHFFEFFEDYRGKELIGIVSGVSFAEGVNSYAERNGLYVLAPSGDSMKILNKPDFKPKVWRYSE